MKTWCSMFLLRSVLPLPMAIILVTFAGGTNSTSQHHGVELLLKQLASWRQHQKESMQGEATTPGYRTLVSCLLCFIAASVSSAGGVGGGSLFLPILNLVAGLDLKAATTYSAFMVTGGSIANVLCNLFFTSVGTEATDPPINYEIALLSQPSMLLGVSLGVICNIMFPEWLITVLFAVFLACSTFRTCKAGVRCWHAETEETETTDGHGRERSVNGAEEALLGGAQSGRIRFPWKDVVVLVMIWVCFFLLHVLAGDKHGKGAINLKPCGVAYWFITLSQVPLAIAFTAYVLYEKKDSHHRQVDTQDKAQIRIQALPVFAFPLAALLTGVLSGLFGIGGGLLLNPVLLQIGIPPQTAAATSSFMVMFSASMTTVKYIILGMIQVDRASVYAVLCFAASAIGSMVMKGIVLKSGRVSPIVFTVTAVMAVSTTTIICYGAIDVWREYTGGKYMGFKSSCEK
ncbi:sulfite exporter TauE/SafE family protein 5-like isoform X1 [Musa acuminata AAA Group]|uniref:sulfite exporter TauE/SafE family protein 5-like isoform X1 n=1 Tax=Musa acuminata AAA Group TaxID=214697 RepID=UPI0031DE4C4A